MAMTDEQRDEAMKAFANIELELTAEWTPQDIFLTAVEWMQGKVDNLIEEHVAPRERELQKLEAENAKLREVAKYALHDASRCDKLKRSGNGQCTCGLDKAKEGLLDKKDAQLIEALRLLSRAKGWIPKGPTDSNGFLDADAAQWHEDLDKLKGHSDERTA